MTNNKKEFWFVVGTQQLYGKETIAQVKNHAQEMTDKLNQVGNLPFKIKFVGTAESANGITKIMKEVNYRDDVIGLITWMHTFSPAKMWIQGTKLLQKPLLHFVTQYNETIPWNSIDMDFMNLNQAAHGDREYGFINARLKKHNKVLVGYWKNSNVHKQLAQWMDVANAYNESNNIRVVRFGDNMRHVGVTEGDKIEAQIKFGWTVDYYPVNDLIAEVEKVSQREVDQLFNIYKKMYTFEYGKYPKNKWDVQVKYQARLEIALKRFLQKGNYNAFTTNFEDLGTLKQLPGLAVQRLMAEGYGFAGEGDWKTAAIDRLLKIMSHNTTTGFMEDYTYEFKQGNEYSLQAHMLEVDPTWAIDKPKILVAPLGIGGKSDPARLIFNGKAGNGVVVSMIDLGDKYKLLINEVEAFTLTTPAPKLPVARVTWKIKPNFIDGIKQWIQTGGGHHTVATLALSSNQIIDWANMVNLEYVLIK
ncbi:MAG: L-arabinose isomerase [Mycoplasmataceae bacterium]|nr:L-arabinose isomerase [Mycoplasmataceae bacterium]